MGYRQIAAERSQWLPSSPPEDDDRHDYRHIYDVSGDASSLNDFIGRLAKGGELVLAGFYYQPISFAFPPAFQREARIRIAAEWQPEDLAHPSLIETRRTRPFRPDYRDRAWPPMPTTAYPEAFENPTA